MIKNYTNNEFLPTGSCGRPDCRFCGYIGLAGGSIPDTAVYEAICEYCGEFAAELFHVVDEDRSVGYSNELMVCEACIDKKKWKF